MVIESGATPVESLEQGVRATQQLVLSTGLKGVSGVYFDGERAAQAKAQAYDTAARKRLRKLSERWAGLDALNRR